MMVGKGDEPDSRPQPILAQPRLQKAKAEPPVDPMKSELALQETKTTEEARARMSNTSWQLRKQQSGFVQNHFQSSMTIPGIYQNNRQHGRIASKRQSETRQRNPVARKGAHGESRSENEQDPPSC